MNRGILGLVLAGGGARRFGADKALADLAGVSLLERVCDRAKPQADALVINRNRGMTACHCAAYPILPDETPGEGPLAGVLVGLSYARAQGFSHLMTFPCDTPFFPADVVARLRAGLIATGADMSTVRCGADEHRAFSLFDIRCASAIGAAFAEGTRSFHDLGAAVTKATVEFPQVGRGPGGNAFFNINRPGDLTQAAAWLGRHSALCSGTRSAAA